MLDLISYAYYRFCVATLSFIYLFIYLSIKGALKSKVEKQITRGSLSRGGVL